MSSPNTSTSDTTKRPYPGLREDPRYEEIKQLINDLPPEKIAKLKSYLRKWSKKP